MDNKNLSSEIPSFQAAITMLQVYCAYRERCHKEVRYKLIQIKVYGDDLENIISHLIERDFLNEERFARSFARGKMRIKKWSRKKVRVELKRREISNYLISKAMTEIDDEEYYANIHSLLEKKMATLPEDMDLFTRGSKASAYMNAKGYSYDEYKTTLKDLLRL